MKVMPPLVVCPMAVSSFSRRRLFRPLEAVLAESLWRCFCSTSTVSFSKRAETI